MGDRLSNAAIAEPKHPGPSRATVAAAATLRAPQGLSPTRHAQATLTIQASGCPSQSRSYSGTPSEDAPSVHSAAATRAAARLGPRGSHRCLPSGFALPHGDAQRQTTRPTPAPHPPKCPNPWSAQRQQPAGRPRCRCKPAPSGQRGGRPGSPDKPFAPGPGRGIGAAAPALGNGHSDRRADIHVADSRCAKPIASCGESTAANRQQGSRRSTAVRRSDAGCAIPEPSPKANWSCSPQNEAQWRGPRGAMSPLQAGCDTTLTSPPTRPTGLRTVLGQGPSSMPASEAITRRSAPWGHSPAPTRPSTAM